MQFSKIAKSRLGAVLAGSVVLVALSGGAATAAKLIGSDDIRNGGVKKVDVAKAAVGGSELRNGSVSVYDLAAGLKGRINGKADAADLDAAVEAIEALTARVATLEGQVDELEGGIEQPWVANPGASITGPGTARMTGSNTSVETTNLDQVVQAGDRISFRVDFADGAACVAGAPRMFVVVDGTQTNSWDVDPATPCVNESAPSPTNSTDGIIEFTVPNGGRISQAGVVWDNGSGGSVTIADITVDGRPVTFQ